MASLCLRYIAHEQDAMQVLNDGFLKAFKSISTYDASRGSLYTWIRKIMVNTAIDFLRRNAIGFTAALSEVPEEMALENNALLKMDAEKLLEWIRKLPRATGLVFNLHTVDGYHHREIGEILGISEGTSRWHLSEARRLLKQYISFDRQMK